MLKENLHKGHRERVRERIEKGGFDCLSDIEILEYILFFSIPRSDTNLLAHRLLKTFASFEGVLEASKDELMTVEGIGQKSAHLLSSYLPVFRYYQMACSKPKSIEYDRTDKVLNFFKNKCLGNKVECSYALYLNQSKRIIKLVHFSKGTFNKTQIFVDQVVKESLTLNARYVVVAHNHTSGSTYPSEADANTAEAIFHALKLVEKSLMDFVIVDHFDGFSFAENGILTESNIINIYQRPQYGLTSKPNPAKPIFHDDDDF